MKKIIISCCMIICFLPSSIGQILKSEATRTASVPLSATDAMPDQTKPPVTPAQQPKQTPVKATVIKQTSVRQIGLQAGKKPIILIPLNSHNAAYQKYMLQSNHTSGNIIKLNEFSKTYVYADGTKSHVYINHVNPKSLVKVLAGVKVDTISQKNSGDDAMDCITTTVSLNANSETFMNNNYASQASYIYPGAIYSFDNLSGGNFKEESNGRNPIYLTTDNTNISGNSYELVQQPNQRNIQNSVTKLFQRFPASATNKASSMRMYASDNSSDLNIKLGVDASGYGVSFDGFVSKQKDERTEYLTVDVVKTLFSISSALPDSGYFKKNAGADAQLLVMGNVSYGIRLLANLMVTFKSEEDKLAFNAGYNGWGVSSNVDFNFLSSNSAVQSTINVYYVGGPSSYTTTAFDKSQLENQITQYVQQANYQNAVPISYELFDLSNNQLGTRSATDQFSIPVCVPKGLLNSVLNCRNGIYNLDPNATNAVIQTGNNAGDNKDRDTHYSFGIFDNNGRPIASFHDNSDNDPYGEGSTTPSLYLYSQNPASFKDFADGGRVHLNIAPNGNDTWNQQSFSLFLKFTNPSSTQKITWQNIHLTEANRDVDLGFKYDAGSNSFIPTSGGGDW